jgi:glycosyltransferase involved in cell wall biosynthesis
MITLPTPQPTLSIVTVTKDSLEPLKRTVNSLRHASDFEYIVQDGLSNDGTAEFISSRLAANYSAISEPDGGIYDAMNKAVLRCNGKFVQFLNAGDCLTSAQACQDVAAALKDDWDIVACGYRMAGVDYPPDLSFRFLLGGMPCHQALIYRRDVLLAHPFETTLHYCADFKQLLDTMFTSRVTTLPHVIVDYDMSGVSSNPAAQRRISLERGRSALASDAPLAWRLALGMYNLLRAAK